jgi:hypothetical protein
MFFLSDLKQNHMCFCVNQCIKVLINENKQINKQPNKQANKPFDVKNYLY